LTDFERQVALQAAMLQKATRDLRTRLEQSTEWFPIPVRDIEHQLANLVLYNRAALRFGVQMVAANQRRVEEDAPERERLALEACKYAELFEQQNPLLKQHRRKVARMVAKKVYGSESHYKTVERARARLKSSRLSS
jgi:hypothetical protein